MTLRKPTKTRRARDEIINTCNSNSNINDSVTNISSNINIHLNVNRASTWNAGRDPAHKVRQDVHGQVETDVRARTKVVLVKVVS